MSPSPGLGLSVDRIGAEEVRVALSGELDLASTSRLEAEMDALLEGQQKIVLDLADVSFMDSTGLRTLWGLRQRIATLGGHLVLDSPSDAVVRVLRMTRLHRAFEIIDGPISTDA